MDIPRSVADDLTYNVIGAAIEVHRIMGPGLLESIYQSCMIEELHLRQIDFRSQYRIPLIYKGVSLKEEFVIDLLFPELLVLELKAVDKITPIHEAQLLTYLKLTDIKIGLIMNFHAPILRDGIKRMML